MITAIACHCGSSDSLVRDFLRSVGYKGWISIPIERGKERSLAVMNHFPPCPEKEMLKSFLRDASKWAVIVGYDDKTMKWSDIAHNGPKSRIEAEFVVKQYNDFTK